MITPDEMRKLLLEEYGIKSDEELNKKLRDLGGIRIGLFIDQRKEAGVLQN